MAEPGLFPLLCHTLSPMCGKEGSGSAHGAFGAISKGSQACFTHEEGGEVGLGGRLLELTPYSAACRPPETQRAKPACSWRLQVPSQVRFDITRQKAQTCSSGTDRYCGAIQ